VRGQPDQSHDLGIGRKVEPKTVQKDPWVMERPGVYRNTETGAMETRIPGNEAANHQPLNPVETWREYLRQHGIDPTF
jgi:hypothetical protein